MLCLPGERCASAPLGCTFSTSDGTGGIVAETYGFRAMQARSFGDELEVDGVVCAGRRGEGPAFGSGK